jgi:hypothetical protein
MGLTSVLKEMMRQALTLNPNPWIRGPTGILPYSAYHLRRTKVNSFSISTRFGSTISPLLGPSLAKAFVPAIGSSPPHLG